MIASRPHPPMERLRRRVLSPLFDRLGCDLVPAVPDWTNRPTSRLEIGILIASASASLVHDLEAKGLPPPFGGVRDAVETLWGLILQVQVRQHRGGSDFNRTLQLDVAMRDLQPRMAIESGVLRGLTTWIIRQACPEAQVLRRDPDLSRLHHCDVRARYNQNDRSTAGRASPDPAETVAFFDDHAAQARRVLEARDRGIARLLFDDDAAGHRIHAHGGPAHPTISMIVSPVDRGDAEPIRWSRNGRSLTQAVNDPPPRENGACVARRHFFDDLQAAGYSPARLTSVTLDLGASR